MLITTVAVCTFVRSSVIANNDLGWRGFLFAQFVLILWSVDFWPEWPKLKFDAKLALWAMLILGVYGTAYQIIMLRVYPVFLDQWTIPKNISSKRESRSADGQFGRRTLAMRQGYTRLESILPEYATIQFNPTGDTNAYFCGLYGNRQVVAFDEACGSSLGGDRRDCVALISRISPTFETLAVQQPMDLDSIDVLVFQDTDPVWVDRSSWIWQVQPLVANDYFRAFATRGFRLQRRSTKCLNQQDAENWLPATAR
jgi:hypothetical protein